MFWDVTETLLNGLGTTFEIFIFTYAREPL